MLPFCSFRIWPTVKLKWKDWLVGRKCWSEGKHWLEPLTHSNVHRAPARTTLSPVTFASTPTFNSISPTSEKEISRERDWELKRCSTGQKGGDTSCSHWPQQNLSHLCQNTVPAFLWGECECVLAHLRMPPSAPISSFSQIDLWEYSQTHNHLSKTLWSLFRLGLNWCLRQIWENACSRGAAVGWQMMFSGRAASVTRLLLVGKRQDSRKQVDAAHHI